MVVKEGQCLETKAGERHKIISMKSKTGYIVVRTNLLPAEKVIVDEKTKEESVSEA